MTNNITAADTARLVRDLATESSKTCTHDGTPSYAYQVGYLGVVVEEILELVPKSKLKEYYAKVDARMQRELTLRAKLAATAQ
jgi:hypothetical protein